MPCHLCSFYSVDHSVERTRPNSALDLRHQNTDCILTYLRGEMTTPPPPPPPPFSHLPRNFDEICMCARMEAVSVTYYTK